MQRWFHHYTYTMISEEYWKRMNVDFTWVSPAIHNNRMISKEYWNSSLDTLGSFVCTCSVDFKGILKRKRLSIRINSGSSSDDFKGILKQVQCMMRIFSAISKSDDFRGILKACFTSNGVIYSLWPWWFQGIIGRGGELGLVLMIASSLVDFNGILKEVVPWPWPTPNQAQSIDPRGVLRERNTYKHPNWCCKRHPSGQPPHTHGQPRPLLGVGLLVIELMVGLVYWVVSSHIGWLWFIVVSS